MRWAVRRALSDLSASSASAPVYSNALGAKCRYCGVASCPLSSRWIGGRPICAMYACKVDKLSAELVDKFHQLSWDQETEDFCQHVMNRRSFLRVFANQFLKSAKILPFTDANAYMDHGHMFVVSNQQINAILGSEFKEDAVPQPMEGDYLDIGAGNGRITSVLKNLVMGQVVATDLSREMVKALTEKGFTAVHTGEVSTENVGGPFKLISIMNVLDRCADPTSLIQQATALLEDDGILVIALVYPYRPWVEKGTEWVIPQKARVLRDTLGSCRSWEDYVEAIDDVLLKPNSLELCKFSRVPYLSESDSLWIESTESMVSLDDALLVCRKMKT